MPSSRSLTALLALPSLALAVSLSDFTPRVSNLPLVCNTVYTSQISGCQPSDFQGNYGCSQSCISALENLVPAVQLACSNAGVTGNNPLSAFINGDGPHSLCANAPDNSTPTPSSTSTTSTTDAPTTTDTPTTTSTPDATTSSTSSTTEATTSSTSTTTSSSSSTMGPTTSSSTTKTSVVAKTTSTTSHTSAAYVFGGSSTTSTEMSSSATAASTTTTSLGNNSGGGSPFDTVNTGAAHALSFSIEHLLALAFTLLLMLQ